MALAAKAALLSRNSRSGPMHSYGSQPSLARRSFAENNKNMNREGSKEVSQSPKTAEVTHHRDRSVAAAAPDFWDPFADVDKTFRQMERMMRNPWRMPALVDDLMGEGAGEKSAKWWKPAVDIAESSDKYTIHAELPGLSKDDVKINIDEGVLTVRGERNLEKKDEDPKKKFTRVERQYGSFTRRFTLPRDVDSSNVKATFNNGILEIVVPRAADKAAQEVRIE